MCLMSSVTDAQVQVKLLMTCEASPQIVIALSLFSGAYLSSPVATPMEDVTAEVCIILSILATRLDGAVLGCDGAWGSARSEAPQD